ncbi:MAG: M1 family metallopeptidase [Bacteroidetes bacterium]|nr:M1 family metallopeptidase [Bacteroidota bacterium]
MTPRLFVFLLAAVSCPALLPAQELFPVRDRGEARDRSYDVLHYRIEVSFDEPQRTVFGTVTTTLVPFQPEFRTLMFDAEEMRIEKVTSRSGASLPFVQGPSTVTITLDRTYSLRDTVEVSTVYSCTPRKGLYFVQPDSGYPDKPRQIWTQGEDMDNHFWFPCYDFPNDKATSEVIATVSGDLTVLSNGSLVRVRENKKEHTRTFHWRQQKPHSSYLIMLAIGEYAVLREKAGSLPLEFYVYPQRVDDARICFRETADMIRFFNEKIGFAYPWEKYAQALIHEFVVGGMENTSATSLADDATVFDARARVDHSATSLIAHELAHQWWGDVVTCKDWRHLWLNEGFASYFDPLYHEATLGRDAFDVIMYEAQKAGIATDKGLGRKPIVSVGSYGANLYPRGASVLHMLRFVLGDELFWRALRHYITKHQFASVETNDFKVAIEEATGQNLYWFFDQWVYKAGYPHFSVSSSWEDSTQLLRLHVEQTQKIDSLTGVFRTPVEIEVTTLLGVSTHRVMITGRDTVFALPVSSAPRLVIFDKGNWILKELSFAKSLEEWTIQAEEAPRPVDRMRALEQLVMIDDSAAVLPVVERMAVADSFWAVRHDAVEALGMFSDAFRASRPSVTKALLHAARDKHPAVRATATVFLTDSGNVEMISALHEALKDSSYTVVARAIRAIAKAAPEEARSLIPGYLDMPSHSNVIASTALSALAEVDSVAGLRESLARMRYGNPPPVRGAALRILRRSAAHGSVSAATFLPLLQDKNIWLRNTAIAALGDCGDQNTLPLLETIALDEKNPSAAVAKRNAEKIRQRIKAEG